MGRDVAKDNFRDNLKKFTGKDPGSDVQAHHVFPRKFEADFQREFGINVNDPRFGTWWEAVPHGKYSGLINEEWTAFFAGKNGPVTLEGAFELGRDQASRFGFASPF